MMLVIDKEMNIADSIRLEAMFNNNNPT